MKCLENEMDLLEFKAVARFLGAQLRVSLRSAVALRGAFAMELLFMALNNLIFFTFWWALFLRVPDVRGHHLQDVALLFGLVAIGYGLHVVFAGGAAELGRLIVDGELDAYLMHPKPVLLAVLSSRSRASGLGDALSGLLLILGFGEIPLQHLAPLAFAIVASALVLTATVTCFWSIAFYVGEAGAVVRLAFEMLLNLSLYPKALFGGLIKGLMFTVIPAAYIGHMPADLVRTPSVLHAGVLMVVAAMYWLGACCLFRHGLRRYSSGSRFGLRG